MSDILRRAKLVERQEFDPKNKKHIASLEHYIRTGNWGEIQFFAEVPFVEVPMTVLMKFASHVLKISRETTVERDDRLASLPDLVRFDVLQTPAEMRAATVQRLSETNAKFYPQMRVVVKSVDQGAQSTMNDALHATA